MAKKVIWTETAIEDRYRIYTYWLLNNGNELYSEKLEKLFKQAAALLASFPKLGKKTDVRSIREKVVRSHKLFYKSTAQGIIILRVWDTRQDPDKLTTFLQNLKK